MNFIFLSLLFLVSCSDNSKVNQNNKLENELIELSPIQINLNSLGEINSTTLDFSSLAFKQGATQDLILSNPSSTQSFSYSLQDFDTLLSSPFVVNAQGCVIVLGPRKKCKITISVTNSVSLSTEQNISSLFKIKNNDIMLTAIFQADSTDYNAPNPSLKLSPSILNFGILKSGEFLELNLIVSNSSNTTIPLNLETTIPSTVSITSNSCPLVLPSRKSCVLKIRYTANITENIVDANLLKVANNQIKYSAQTVTPSINEPEILSVTPLTNNLLLNLNNSTVSTGTIRFKNNMSSNFPGPIIGVSSHNGLQVQSISCSGGITRGRFCDLNYLYSSAILPSGTSVQTLRLQSGTKASESYNINFSIPNSLVACELSDAQLNGWNIEKAVSASGMKNESDVSGCIVSSCIQSYEVNNLNKKCLVNLDPDNDNIISNNEFNLLLNDAHSGYISSIIELDSNKVYEFDDQIDVPANVTIQGPSSTNRAVIRKKNDLINGIDKAAAQNIKNLVIANLPLVMFDVGGDVIGYNGDQTITGLQNARNALTSYYENNNLLDPVVVSFGSKKYRFDLDGYGTRCKDTVGVSAGESYVCPSSIPTGTTKFTPFFQEILNTPLSEFTQYNKNTVTPIFLIQSANVTLKNLDIACPNDVPYFPIHEMINIGNPKPNGEVQIFNGSRIAPGFTTSAVYITGAMNINFEGLSIDHCSLGIYSINSRNVNIKNNIFLSAVKENSIHPIALEEQGDFQSAWKHRFHGINNIRIHGTYDKNFLIQNNTFGTATSGAQKAIHIHGTSLSNRDHDNDDVIDIPPQIFTTNDEGLIALGPYADRSDSSNMRKNFKIIGNTIQSQHISGIDLEGDQLNAEIRDNLVFNIKDKFFIPEAQSSIDGGVGIRILTEVSPLNLFNLFGSGTAYNMDFVGSPKNFLIQNNTVQDSSVGIMVLNKNNNLLQNFAFDNFPENPVTPIANNYNCALESMNANCSNQMSIVNNQIRRIKHGDNALLQYPSGIALQSTCLSISGMIGIEVKNNIFDTCGVPLFDYNGNASAISVVNSKKIHFNGNTLSIDSATANARTALGPTAGLVGLNRYYGIRFTKTSIDNINTLTRLVAPEFLISGCASQTSCLGTFNFKISAGGLLGTQAVYDINGIMTNSAAATHILENPTNNVINALSPYLFIPSAELNNIVE